MRALILPLVLALIASTAGAEDEWVAIGADRKVAPAQANVITSPASSESDSQANSTSGSSNANAELMSELLTQVEQMQQEIAQLRSTVETQQQQLQTIEQQQQNRYLDLDRRVAYLMSRNTETTATSDQANSTHNAPAESGQVTSGDAYKAAMQLVRERQYPAANEAFAAFIKEYPQDPLVANAYYWNGEVYLVRNEPERAKADFERVVNEYSTHNKAADASYKLGVTLHKMGKPEQARRWLNQVVERYSTSGDAGARTVRQAQSYLKKIESE